MRELFLAKRLTLTSCKSVTCNKNDSYYVTDVWCYRDCNGRRWVPLPRCLTSPLPGVWWAIDLIKDLSCPAIHERGCQNTPLDMIGNQHDDIILASANELQVSRHCGGSSYLVVFHSLKSGMLTNPRTHCKKGSDVFSYFTLSIMDSVLNKLTAALPKGVSCFLIHPVNNGFLIESLLGLVLLSF